MSKKPTTKRNEYADPCMCGHRRSRHSPENAMHFAVCNGCKEDVWSDDIAWHKDWIHPFKLDAFKFIDKLKKANAKKKK